jgi:peptidoglycan hydrolase-like protein with peptidoglycan-binding domain
MWDYPNGDVIPTTGPPRRPMPAVTGRPLRLLVGVLMLAGVLAVPRAVAGADPVLCDGEAATIVGTSGPDVLTGTAQRDVIAGLGGDDRIEGLAGADLICAGPGQDVVLGGAGPDRIFGEGGDDFLYGQDGDDYLAGGPGDDLIEGGFGSDRLLGEGGADELWGTSCVPMEGLGHFCRHTPLHEDAGEQGDFTEVLEGARLLSAGMSGTDVVALQDLLLFLGFDPGPSDGVFGPATEAAVIAFQTGHDLEADGVIGLATREALSAALEGEPPASDLPESTAAGVELGTRLLRTGLHGTDVAQLQSVLTALGFDPGPADGIFGTGTAAAVRAFQVAHDLQADGVAGPQTLAALLGAGTDDSLVGGLGFDTCNSPDTGTGCESTRGLRTGAPWNASAAEEWRSVVAQAFTERGLEDEIEHALAIVACESLGDPFITTPSSPAGAYVAGLFQHKDIYWARRAESAGLPGASIFDPLANARVAAWMVARSVAQNAADPDVERPGWTHWVCDEGLAERGLWE